MIVVADTSPIVALGQLDLLDLLPRLFGQVLIPPEVVAELLVPETQDRAKQLALARPSWLVIRAPVTPLDHPDLHSGESAAIALAEQERADAILIDERLGHQIANERGLRTVRTAALIKLAADIGLVADLRATFERLAHTDFRVPKRVLDELVRDHLQRRNS